MSATSGSPGFLEQRKVSGRMRYSFAARFSVAMFVANNVLHDSRVLRTAASLTRKGFRVHLYGVNDAPVARELAGHAFPITLLPNPRSRLRKEKAWLDDQGRENLQLLMESYARLLAGVLARRNVDFLHTHDMVGLPVGGLVREINPAIGKYGWIHDIHEFVEGVTNAPEYFRLFYWEAEKRHLHEPDALTTVSPILADTLAQNYGVPKPGLVMNTPRKSDFDSFLPVRVRQAAGLGDEVPLLIYNGGLARVRGVHTAVESLPLLEGVHLLLLSNSKGKYVEELVDKARADGAGDRLHFHPYVPSHDVTSFVRGATLGINPVTIYPNSDLAFPNKIFEYLHAGVPIVSSNTTAMEDFLVRHECGVTFRPGDCGQFAQAVGEAFQRFPHGLPNVGQGSKIAEEYCWENQERTLENLYAKLCGDAGAAAATPPASGRVWHVGSYDAFFKGVKPILGQQDLCRHEKPAGGPSKLFDNLLSSIGPAEERAAEGAPDATWLHLHFNEEHWQDKGFEESEAARLLILVKALPSMRACLHLHRVLPGKGASSRLFFKLASKVCDLVLAENPVLQCIMPTACLLPQPILLPEPGTRGPGGVTDIRIFDLVKNRPESEKTALQKAFLHLQSLGHKFSVVPVQPTDFSIGLPPEPASVAVGSLSGEWYGDTDLRAMAARAPLVLHIRKDLRYHLPFPAPFLYASEENIESVLETLFESAETRAATVARGLEFLRKNHDPEQVMRTFDELQSAALLETEFLHFGKWILSEFLGSYAALEKSVAEIQAHCSQCMTDLANKDGMIERRNRKISKLEDRIRELEAKVIRLRNRGVNGLIRKFQGKSHKL